MMEAVMHCGSVVLDYRSSSKQHGLVTSTGSNGGLCLKKEDFYYSSSVRSLRGGAPPEFSFGPTRLDWRAPHRRSPRPSVSSCRRISCSFGQRTIHTAQPATDNERAVRIEEEQKQLLKKKALSVHKDLGGTSIYLVGMMGSGKSTVGKYVAEALGYHFCDSDKLVEVTAGESVKQMFHDGREEEFRNAESKAIMQLSSRVRMVVATGGGVVVRPQNWSYLRQGITVWLDVPLEALAERVVAVGCDSRPLLGQVSPETAYLQALQCLENLFKERVGYYKNADASVCVAGLATMIGLDNVSAVTPTMLAVQVLETTSLLIRKRRFLHDRTDNS